MTRKLFWLATALFWLGVLGAWLSSRWPSDPKEITPKVTTREFSLEVVARHSSEADCWMAINGKVYDLSTYIPEHPSRQAIILAWCGKEATEAYRTKMKGRPHSSTADQLLETYEVGLLQNQL